MYRLLNIAGVTVVVVMSVGLYYMIKVGNEYDEHTARWEADEFYRRKKYYLPHHYKIRNLKYMSEERRLEGLQSIKDNKPSLWDSIANFFSTPERNPNWDNYCGSGEGDEQEYPSYYDGD